MVQELPTQDIVNVTTNDLTPEQEDILWWEYYEKIYYLNTDNGESQFS
jgi:hypothetical protein